MYNNTLHLMGFADTSKETAACLNACIEAVHAQLQAQNKHSTVPIENVGTPDSAWHFRVVYTAFRLRKKQFTFKKVSREKWAEVLLDPRSTKCYLVDGILNISFRGRKGTKQKEETISQLFDPEISIDGNWRHSTAVMHGFWICRGRHMGLGGTWYNVGEIPVAGTIYE